MIEHVGVFLVGLVVGILLTVLAVIAGMKMKEKFSGSDEEVPLCPSCGAKMFQYDYDDPWCCPMCNEFCRRS